VVRARPLEGVRVLDLGRLMPSAIATAELGKLGADVVKVEMPPHGDYLRVNPPLIDGRGDMHLDINRNKRSIGVHFEKPAGRELLLRLVSTADVFVELSRPGAMERLGLDYNTLRASNPSLVYASFSGFGHTGPYSELAAHGLSADGASGFLPVMADGGRRVLPEPYVSVGPRAAGLYGAIAILGALVGRSATGRGQHLDISQGDAAIAWYYREMVLTANTGTGTPSYRSLGPRYEIYRCADDRYVLFAATEPHLWRRFCNVADRPDLADSADDVAVEYHDDPLVRAALETVFAARTRAEWVELGIETGIPITPVVESTEITSDEHVRARGMVQRQPHPLGGDMWLTGHPVRFSDGDVTFTPAPELGQHTVDVLSESGFDEAEVAAAVEMGAVVQWDRS